MTCHKRGDATVHPLTPVTDDDGRIVAQRCACGEVDVTVPPPMRSFKERI